MNLRLTFGLNGTPDKLQRLHSLQQAFARVCNALAPTVQQHRCWNRVALHHLAYKSLREQFPEVGSQMVCNAIYSVCRSARLVYQHPRSPFNVGRAGVGVQTQLPRLVFLPDSPVYFDRHTLSIKEGRLSMYTLDGRVHFDLALQPEQLPVFTQQRLREVVLQGAPARGYSLAFEFEGPVSADGAQPEPAASTEPPVWPPYLQVETTI